MREMEFTMVRGGLVNKGDKVVVSEDKIPAGYYYTVDPAVAMSGNYQFHDRLKSREGIVKDIRDGEMGYVVVVEFDE